MMLRADSLAATEAIASALAQLSRPGDVVVLAGEMGAGKTTFAQCFGRALGVVDAITSPTFTLVHSYPVPGRRLTLHHADLYRLDRTSELHHLALDELAEFDGVVLIEWGDVAAATLGDHLTVRLDREPDDDELDDDESDAGESDETDDFGLDEPRLIEIDATGRSWAGRWDRVLSALEDFRC
jgi:tRNA threonylcarbamoyladenosine biosynthesis protein TsaE